MTNREPSDGALPPAGRADSAANPRRDDLAAFARRVVVVVLVLALAYLAWRGIHVLTLAFAGVLFAVLLTSLSQWLSSRTGIRYGWALAAVILALVLLTAGLGWLLANRLAVQGAELARQLPQSLQQIRDYLEAYPAGRLLLQSVPEAAGSLARTGELSQVTSLVSGVGNFLVAVVVILFVGIFGAAEPKLYRTGLLHLVPRASRRRVDQALDAVVFNLRWWLVGQVILMVMMGVTTSIGLWLLGVPLALALGVIAGILEMIPYLGTWLSAALSGLIALLLSPWHLAMTLVLYLGLHILEGYLLVPLVQRRAIHLPPALTLVSQILLGELLGLLGLFVAAPLTVSAVVFLKMLYVEDALGDRTVEVPGGPEEEPH